MLFIGLLVDYIVRPLLLLELLIAAATFVMLKRKKDIRHEVYYSVFKYMSGKYLQVVTMLTGIKEGEGLYLASAIISFVLWYVLGRIV